MCQSLMYEIPLIQFKLLKKNSESVRPIIFNSISNIKLHGLEAIPKDIKKKYPIAILFHGISSNYFRMMYIANQLIMNRIAVLSVNLRGHGRSSGKRTNVEGMQQDLNYIMNYIEKNDQFDTKRILLLGNSLGALIALTAGYNQPKITHIIGLSGFSSPSDFINGMNRFRRWRWKLIGKLGGINIFDLIGKTQFIPKLQTQMNEISKKILLIHSKNDRLVSVNNFWANVSAFNLEKGNYTVLPTGGHSFFLTKKRVIYEINKWLKRTNF